MSVDHHVGEVYDFDEWLHATASEIRAELAKLHAELATLHEIIAYNRILETHDKTLKEQRINDEGHRDALNEKKWLLIRLLPDSHE